MFLQNRFRHIGISITLVTLLTSVYMLTYSGRIESRDTLTLLDVTNSLVYFGDKLLDLSASENEPYPAEDHRLYPLSEADVEPLQPVLAAPLLWLAKQLPGIGLAHAVWLFNVFVSALAGGVLFVYGLTLGYDEHTSVLAVLIFGLGTSIWPYSKTFFREPLALLLILLAALLFECWRASRYRSVWFLGGAVLAVSGGLLTKEAVIFAIPAFALIVLPGLPITPRLQAILTKGGMILLIVIVGLVFLTVTGIADVLGGMFHLLERYIPSDPFTARTAFHSYLMSIGGSVWGTSPITLLALPGFWLLFRGGRYRYVFVISVLVLSFAFGYAALRSVHWFGGVSWPPRFLLPVIPFLIIGALPVLERIRHHLIPTGLTIGIVVLIIYSFWIQLSGVTLPWDIYPMALPPEAHGLIEWSGGLNEVRYLRWLIIPGLWSQHELDFVWIRTGVSLWPFLFGGMIVLSAISVVGILRMDRLERLSRRFKSIIVFLPVAMMIVIGLGLRLIYADPFYQPAAGASLETIMTAVEKRSQPGDVLLLANDNYARFFLNYGKLNKPRMITLPDPPGEQPSPEQSALVRAENPSALLIKSTIPLIQNLAANRSHLWLLADTGPWMPWSVRPVERFMAQHYFPIREIATDPPDPQVRLIEYDTTAALDPYTFRGPDNLTKLVYGKGMRLVGYDLPHGRTYHRGDILSLSLYWQTDQLLTEDYTVAWFVLDENHQIMVQGMDSQPGGGFAPTREWRIGAPIWDNRALYLPADLEPGDYQIAITMYNFDSMGNIHNLSVSGGLVADDHLGILPVAIKVDS